MLGCAAPSLPLCWLRAVRACWADRPQPLVRAQDVYMDMMAPVLRRAPYMLVQGGGPWCLVTPSSAVCPGRTHHGSAMVAHSLHDFTCVTCAEQIRHLSRSLICCGA